MTRNVPFRAALCVLVVGIPTGCGNDGGPMPDAGDAAVDTDASVLPVPEPPASPAPPDLTPCPDGWRGDTSDDGFSICQPFAGTGPDDCASNEAHYPGAPRCTAIGSSCPADDGWASDLPTGRPVLYVRPGGSGDGTEADPFGTIGEAVTVAGPTSVIALAVGEYVEVVAIPTGVALVGACAAGTRIRADTARFDRGVVNPEGAGVEIRDVTIAESPRPGLWVVGEGVSVTVRDLIVAGAQVAGISVEEGASLDAERVLVRDVTTAPLLPVGRGVNVESGASARVRFYYARNNIEFGAVVLLGASLVITDATITGTRAPIDGVNGGPGLGAFSGGHLEARRIALADNEQSSLLAFDEGTTADVEDLAILGVRPYGPLSSGRGIDIERGSTLTCTRCLLEETSEIAVAMGDADLVLTDVLIHRTRPRADGTAGRGITVQLGGSATLSRVAIVDGTEHGIVVDGNTSMLTADDLIIRRISAQRDETMGRAMTVQLGGRAVVRRADFREIHDMGVLAARDSRAVIEDLTLTDVLPGVAGTLGRGINVQNGGELELTRGRIESVYETAITTLTAPSRSVLRDVFVTDVQPQECANSSCRAIPGGHGFGAHGGATLEADRFVVEDAAVCGLFVSVGGSLDLRRGVVRRAAIGACVQSEAQDLDALARDVSYVDNGSNLEATELPVPEAAALPE